MDNTLLTILGSAIVSWIGIYIKIKLDTAADKGYYVKTYKRSIYSLFLMVVFVPVIIFICVANQDIHKLELSKSLIVMRVFFSAVLIMFLLLLYKNVFRNKKQKTTNWKDRLDIFNFIVIYYVYLQIFFLVLLYFETYSKFQIKQEETWFLIFVISMLSILISLYIHLLCRPRLKKIFFQDTYEKIRKNYDENKEIGYFYVDETMLTDHMMFCLTNGFYCSRLPLHELVKITGEEKRVIFFSDSTIDYFKFEDKKAEIKRSKEAKKAKR